MHRSADEIQADCLVRMGRDLGGVYYALWTECVWLHFKWRDYVELYGTNPERIALLNRSAGRLSRVIQDALWNDVLLHLCRLTDDVAVGRRSKHETLTVKRLPNLVDAAIMREVQSRVNTAVKSVDDCARDVRNRRLAHHHLALALTQEGATVTVAVNAAPVPLKQASRAAVRAALKSLVSVLNVIEAYYLNTTVAYEESPSGGSAISLLLRLRDADESRTARSARIKAGDYTEDDLKSLRDRRKM